MKKFYIIILLLWNISLSANIVATITALKGSAEIKRDTQILQAKLASKLENKDNIFTADNSKMQVIFLDDTILTVGKNSHLSIEDYLYEDNQEPAARFEMLKGAMRVITGGIGKIAPHKFSVQTKTATIGIRGTNFTVIVKPNGAFKLYCTYGATSAIHNSKQHIIKQSYTMSVSPTGRVNLNSFDPSKLNLMKKKHFEVDQEEELNTININDISLSNQETKDGLDLKFEEDELTLQYLIKTASDNILRDNYSKTDSSTISSYSMEHAEYRGRYTSSYSEGTLNKSGDAAMTIDFGKDTAWLGLGSFADPKEQVRYNFMFRPRVFASI